MSSVILGTLLLLFFFLFGAVFLRRKPVTAAPPAAANAPCISDEVRGSDEDTEEEKREEEEEKNEGREVKPSRLRKRRDERQRQREEAQRQREETQRQRQRQETQREREETREREAAERQEAEERALEELREERRRRDDEEYAKWVGAIGVEERGELGDEELTRREALVAFVTARGRELEERQQRQQSGENTVVSAAVSKEGKGARNILVLSDVAREYGVTVDGVVQLIEKLLEDGIISGVFDDRGKFVMVAEAHFVKIAEFIQQRGRVSVRELVRECNKVVLS